MRLRKLSDDPIWRKSTTDIAELKRANALRLSEDPS
jgi:hypothetical protein